MEDTGIICVYVKGKPTTQTIDVSISTFERIIIYEKTDDILIDDTNTDPKIISLTQLMEVIGIKGDRDLAHYFSLKLTEMFASYIEENKERTSEELWWNVATLPYQLIKRNMYRLEMIFQRFRDLGYIVSFDSSFLRSTQHTKNLWDNVSIFSTIKYNLAPVIANIIRYTVQRFRLPAFKVDTMAKIVFVGFFNAMKREKINGKYHFIDNFTGHVEHRLIEKLGKDAVIRFDFVDFKDLKEFKAKKDLSIPIKHSLLSIYGKWTFVFRIFSISFKSLIQTRVQIKNMPFVDMVSAMGLSANLNYIYSLVRTDNTYSLLYQELISNYLKKCHPKVMCVYNEGNNGIYAIYKTAKSFGLTTVGLQHGVFSKYHIHYGIFANHIENTNDDPPYRQIPDFTFVYGDHYYSLLKDFGYPSSKLRILGCPRLDYLYQLRKTENRREHITILTQLYPYDQVIYPFIDDVLSLINKYDPESNIIIKIHHREDEARYEKYLSDPRISINRNTPLAQVFKDTKMIFGLNSTALLEAAAAGKFVVSYNNPAFNLSYFFDEASGVVFCPTIADLSQVIEKTKLLAYTKEMEQRSIKLISNYYSNLGDSTTKSVEELLSLID